MTEQSTSPSRRLILGAMAAIPAAAIAAPALASLPADRSEWDRLLADLRRADAESAAADAREDATRAAYEAAKPSMDMIDFRELNIINGFGHDRHHIAHGMDIEVERRRFIDGENKWWWAPDPERNRAIKARRHAAFDSVLEFRRLDAEAERATGYAAANEALDAACERFCDIQGALITHPAPDREAMLHKLEILFGAEARSEDDCGPAWCAEWINALMADARRLLATA